MRLPSFAFLTILALACTKTPQQIREKAAKCAGSGDWECAEENYRWLLDKKPDDVIIRANLGFALTKLGQHQQAVSHYEKVIDAGEGTYDVFARFGESLAALGREDEAITWYYRTLAIVPSLVDVRGDLAKLLVKKKRPYEALSLLASFDESLELKGSAPYFKGQRLAIASRLPQTSENVSRASLQIPKLDGHYVAVVMDGNGEPLPFMIDTGASDTTLSPKTLEALGVTIPSHAKSVRLKMADGREAKGQTFRLQSLNIGGMTLKNIEVIVCDDCASLLGQTALEHFDLATRKEKGLEFLTMTRRS